MSFDMNRILSGMFRILERIRSMEELSTLTLILFGAMFLFGLLNCVLGYRLLRFWVMLGGFVIGAFSAIFLGMSFGIESRKTLLFIGVGTGVVLAIVAFLIYKAGIFLLGAGLGALISTYILHPTTSAIFFLCLLLGVVVGILTLKFAKEILILATSLAGGILAGFSLAKLLGMREFPYGILISLVFVVLGILIQFLTNRVSDEEEELPEDPDEMDSSYANPISPDDIEYDPESETYYNVREREAEMNQHDTEQL